MAEGKKVVEIGVRRFWGIVLLPLCLFVALSLFSYDWKDISILHVPANSPPHNLIGPLGAWLSFALFNALGVGAYLVPLWLLVFGVTMVSRASAPLWPRLLWCVVLTLAVTMIVELRDDAWAATRWRLNLADVGGIMSGIVTRGVLVRWLSPVGAGILVWSLFVVSLVMFPGIRNAGTAIVAGGAWSRGAVGRLQALIVGRQDRRQRIETETRKIEKDRKRIDKAIRKQQRIRAAPPREPAAPKPAPAATTQPAPAGGPPPEPPSKPAPAKGRRGQAPRTAPEREAPGLELPPISLLEEIAEPKDKGIKADTGTTSRLLIETLAEFGIDAEITSVEKGPVVTRYELLPAPGVRIERISGLSNNLALSLKATSVRVQAPVPGKGVVGVEVPNSIANMVSLREILEGQTWQSGKAKLPLVLGKDVGGNDIVADLTEMPHLLIAGATGSGKTVCMNSVLAGLLMSRTPAQLRLMLVDPKIVEFAAYNNLPHLVVPVITDPKKVAIGLRWAISEMEKRYKLFAKVGVRNIESYNHRLIATQDDLFDGAASWETKDDEPPPTLPYIVVVIDELADLMLVAQADIENCVARLAQLSRAVGIHMILSTQRPSVNVITGTIKANFPARIAFQVAQKVDSRTILDSAGADKLLGRGDMLFQPPGTSRMLRAQGAMTTDGEIRKIAEFLIKQAEPVYELEILDKIQKKGAVAHEDEEDEELLSQAVEIIRETQRASTSSLQRRLRIGYTRAARIMDILEGRGIVGPPRGSDPREILVDLDVGMPDNAEDSAGEEEAEEYEEEAEEEVVT